MAPTTKRDNSRGRWWALTVLCAAQLMIILDQNIVNVALPAIQDDLGFATSHLVWTVNAYVIPFGGLLLLAGRLGDLLGRARVLAAGLVVFTVASLLCGLATSQDALIAARFLQGIGGAAASAGILGIIAALFPEAGDRSRAIGAFTLASAGGAASGPLIGGVLTDGLGWQWIFYTNVPLGALVLVLAWRLVPEPTRSRERRSADVPGAVLVTAGVMTAVYALVGAVDHGWGSARTGGLLLTATVLLLLFALREATATDPLLPLGLFRSRRIVVANSIQLLLIAAMFGFLYFGTLYLQQVLGYSALMTGMGFVPTAFVIAVMSLLVTPRLIRRFGERTVIPVGLVLLVVGLASLSRISADGAYVSDVLPGAVLLGLGLGVALPATTMLGMADATARDAGVVSGLFNTSQQVGGAIGLAVLGTVAAARTTGERGVDDSAEALAAADTAGFALAFQVATWLVAATLPLLLLARGRRRPSAAGEGEGAVSRELVSGERPAPVGRD